MKTTFWIRLAALAVFAAVVSAPGLAHAYVGPGAGIAVATTLLAFVISAFVALIGLLFWPVRFVIRMVTRKKAPKPAKIDRMVIIGLDGLDPKLVRRFMDEGRLPNMQRIAAKGSFRNLSTTYPAMSPVAWSSFATGVDPAKHGIFDFLTRNPKTYTPDLSSADVRPPRRSLKIGAYRIPVSKPQLALLRKSKSFWELLGTYQVPCSILRVPITFPPEKFDGTLLSAMCVPDLQGSQGSFAYFSSAKDGSEAIGGTRIPITVRDGVVETALPGPPNPIHAAGEPVTAPMRLVMAPSGKRAVLHVSGKKVPLVLGEYTEWIEVSFKLGLGVKLRGICRFRLLESEPNVKLYVTPINIDPENPVLPISHPRYFSMFLAKMLGKYATLGLAEDTWALNEGVLDEDAFLEQAWANHAEREAMFFEMLRRTRKGVITCVFDGTDRIQHMFMRYLDEEHPALSAERRQRESRYKEVIPETYARMDVMVGKVLEQVDMNDPKNLVCVMSDHGFQTFRRGVNLNSWLHQHGYLVLEEGRSTSGEWFRGVDWAKTRAFALGLGGIFLNVKGREGKGLVEPSEVAALADELAEALSGLIDPQAGQVAIQKVYASHRLYKGPYADDAPDLIVGYAAGWRASWDGVRGIIDDVVFDDNTKAWSGDHCIDPELVPGVLIASQNLGPEREQPAIADMAPTILDLFGVPAPRYMDGKSLVSA